MSQLINDILTITAPDFPDAVCADVNPEIFFPSEVGANAEEAISAAKEFCFRCTHRVECLEFANKEEITFGIWGGYSSKERASIGQKRFKPRSDLGLLSLNLRDEGLKMKEIAAMLNSTPTAVSKAIGRHIQMNEAAK